MIAQCVTWAHAPGLGLGDHNDVLVAVALLVELFRVDGGLGLVQHLRLVARACEHGIVIIPRSSDNFILIHLSINNNKKH